MRSIHSLFFLILILGCGPNDAELEARRSLIRKVDRTEQRLRETRADRDAWKARAEDYWDRARRAQQRPHEINAATLEQLRRQVSSTMDNMVTIDSAPNQQLLLSTRSSKEHFRLVVFYNKMTPSISTDVCIFDNPDGLVDRAWHTWADGAPEHPNGTQELNASNMTGLEEAEYWQKECTRLAGLALNN